MDIDFENVAVAKVSWVSILEMLLWLRFWGCQNRRKRSRLTPVQRDALRDFSKTRSRGPGEGRERLLSFSFQYTVYSYQLTSGQVGQVTGAVTRVYTPLGRWPRRICFIHQMFNKLQKIRPSTGQATRKVSENNMVALTGMCYQPV